MARQRLGAALVVASAAAIAVGRLALPVYEIYKVGDDPFWNQGLDLFGPYNLNLVVVSHWNNNDGGSDVDTSRCFIGQQRFEALRRLLPRAAAIIGIDEHTALIMNLIEGRAAVSGVGRITVIHDEHEQAFASGDTLHLEQLGPYRLPEPQSGIRRDVWAQAEQGDRAAEHITAPSAKVTALVEQREAARASHDWATSDSLRERIAALGWRVDDTPNGPRLERLS